MPVRATADSQLYHLRDTEREQKRHVDIAIAAKRKIKRSTSLIEST